ncbi:5-formyltetrahydrofolate cyclo-ligase [Solibacillus silvestris]|uniref:5-formyltetrahydrofolate cyclo-ligase n=1 Tax=Solibacillus silvestris TaxID=76853 RepID=UPI003F7CEAB9
MEKREYRKQVQEKLAEMTHQTYRERSLNIAKQLLQEPSIQKANTIAITLSNQPEVDTTFIIEQLWKLNKQVAIPKCDPTNRSMQFYKIDSFAETERAFKNILEPIPEITEPAAKEELDVIIVPGVVFDRRGYRIGFGGGYYDRYLAGFNGKRISLSFKEQLLNNIPRESHDLPVHIILTDKERIICE